MESKDMIHRIERGKYISSKASGKALRMAECRAKIEAHGVGKTYWI